MRFSYGQIGTILAAGGGVGQVTDMDAGDDANQLSLYIDQQPTLTGVMVIVSALVQSGGSGGSVEWKTVEARASLSVPYGPATNPDEGLLLTANVLSATRWRIEFKVTGGSDVVANPAIKWMAVRSRTDTVGLLPQMVHRAVAALPAAGAWTGSVDTPDKTGMARFKDITWSISYTRGAVGGFPRFRAIWKDSLGTEFQDAITFPSSIELAYIDGPVPPDGTALNYIFSSINMAAFSSVRLEASEAGVPATPGTLAIWLSARTSG